MTHRIKPAYLGFAVLLLLCLACKRKMPSTHEIHYTKDLKDSVVFVNYNLTADSSCNFYMEYPLFKKLFRSHRYERVYTYHMAHLMPAVNDTIYRTYKRKEFYSNNNPDTAAYYQSGSSPTNRQDNKSLKPSVPYQQPSRPYSYRK